MWHGYVGIENLALNVTQRATLVAELRALGPESDPQPARLNHRRVRLDGDAVIFEALFNESALTVDAFKNRLASIFEVDPETIATDATTHHFAGGDTPIVVFSRGVTDYLRLALFGGVSSSWESSGDECRGYLKLYQDAWELAE